MKQQDKRHSLTILFLLGSHLLGLLFLSLFRIAEYAFLHTMVEATEASAWPAFVRGLWFDNVVGCYILVVPIALCLLAGSAGYYARWTRKAASLWMCILYTLCFSISAANIPYFQYFFKNINSGIFGWFGYAGTTAGMVFGESSYLIYICLFVLATLAFILLNRAWRKHIDRKIQLPTHVSATAGSRICNFLLSLLLTGLCIFGIRGRIGYNPIKVSEAYYCTDPLLNQLGIAPTFNLLTSVMDDMRKENTELQLMPYAEAITEARKSLHITGRVDSADVLHRHVMATASLSAGQEQTTVSHTSAQERPNIVIILMESMSASLLQTFGQPQPLTPVLDSLCRHSLAFTRCFSAGVHTNHGITASLYSFPAMMKRNLMKGTVTPHRAGIPTVLKDAGYQNMFFMTHEAQYDNMNAFLRTNGYDEVYSQENYPSSEVVNSFGVSDRYLFRFALQKMNQKASKNQPFMATLLTVSNHPPYVLPADFRPKSKDKETQIVEYADDCIGRFLQQARRQAWFENTVFVLLADHGKIVGNVDSELPQSYNHIPLLIFGKGIENRRYEGLATQVDLMPTLLGLLGMEYDYNGFGINLLQQQRDMVFYSADDQIVARDSSSCFIYTSSTGHRAYYTQTADGNLTPTREPPRHDAIRRYAFAMIQTAEYCYRHQK